MSTEITKQAQFQRLYGAIGGFQSLWLVVSGTKAGLWRAIAAEPGGITEAQLAQRLKYDLRYTRTWCRGAYAYGLLDWDEQSGYRLPLHFESLLLDSSDPMYMAGGMMVVAGITEDFQALPKLLGSGKTWPRSEHDPSLLQAIVEMTKPDCILITEQVLPQASGALARLEAGGILLDIGAGGGAHVIHYAKRFPKARVVGLEYDAASIELANQNIAAAGMEQHIAMQRGDALRLADENAYDVITMNIALHETGGPAEYRQVLKNVRRALKPGGAVIVSELPYPDTVRAYREQPVYQALAGIQVHEAIVGCGMITQGELRDLLEEAQFANVRVAKQSRPSRHVMIGEKPA